MRSDLTTWSDEELLAFIYPKDGDDLCADCGMFNADEYGDCDVMCNSLAITELSRRLTDLRAAHIELLEAAEAVARADDACDEAADALGIADIDGRLFYISVGDWRIIRAAIEKGAPHV